MCTVAKNLSPLYDYRHPSRVLQLRTSTTQSPIAWKESQAPGETLKQAIDANYLFRAHPANPVQFASFSGAPDEAVSVFIQAVNQVCFVHGHSDDAAWAYRYAESCLRGPALLWFHREYLAYPGTTAWPNLSTLLLLKYEKSVGVTSPSGAAPVAAAASSESGSAIASV